MELSGDEGSRLKVRSGRVRVVLMGTVKDWASGGARNGVR